MRLHFDVRIKLLALDLEGTLVDNALTANARPGLFDFLAFCEERFDRVALLTTVDEDTAREVFESLERHRQAPGVFVARVEYVDWNGEHKDLRFVRNATPDEILFVDDDPGWIHPDQHGQWISIAAWNGGADNELVRVQAVLEQMTEANLET